MTILRFPSIVIIDLAYWHREFNQCFQTPPCDADFTEIVTQVLYQLINDPYEKVLEGVGVVFPYLHRMRDTSFVIDMTVANQLTIATVNLTSAVIADFKMRSFFTDARELPYFPKNFYGDLITLEYLPF